MIETKSAPSDPHAPWIDVAARLIRIAPRLTTALGVLTGIPFRREPRQPDEPYSLCERDAKLLDAAPSTAAIHRDGYLVSALGGSVWRGAEVTSLVLVDRLGLSDAEREEFDTGEVPLGELLTGAQRVTHFAYRVPGPPLENQAALQIRGTLLLAGCPVALVEERVLWRTILHRASSSVPHAVRAHLSGTASWRL